MGYFTHLFLLCFSAFLISDVFASCDYANTSGCQCDTSDSVGGLKCGYELSNRMYFVFWVHRPFLRPSTNVFIFFEIQIALLILPPFFNVILAAPKFADTVLVHMVVAEPATAVATVAKTAHVPGALLDNGTRKRWTSPHPTHFQSHLLR